MFARIRVCSISVQMKSLWKEGFIELVRTMHTKEWNEPRSNHLFVIALMLHFAQYFFVHTRLCATFIEWATSDGIRIMLDIFAGISQRSELSNRIHERCIGNSVEQLQCDNIHYHFEFWRIRQNGKTTAKMPSFISRLNVCVCVIVFGCEMGQ